MSQEPLLFDIVVLGGGPGGYPAAIKAAQSGKKVALIEAKELGGTCLNRGCIPSKALIANAKTYQTVLHAKEFGIHADNVSFRYETMAKRKDQVVGGIRKGLEGLLKTNGITIIRGHGQFVSPREIKVQGEDNCVVSGERFILATGSEPRDIPAFPCDHKAILDSTSALELTELPKSIVIIGGGVIGCEFASLFRGLGVEVTICELLDRILPMEAEEVSKALDQSYRKWDVTIHTGVLVEGIKTEGKGVTVHLKDSNPIHAEKALVAVGRKLNVRDAGFEKAGVVLNEKGFVQVDERMETNVPGIYAVGDIVSPWWLAHVATHQGVIAATNATGGDMVMHYNAIPSVIFTHLEIGTVGKTIEQAKKEGYQAAVSAFPFKALGKSQAIAQTEGFAQIVIDQKTGQILGAQVVGYEAATLVAEMAVAITNELTVECITESIHAHPTLPEAWAEAAFLATGSPLHLPPTRKKKTLEGVNR